MSTTSARASARSTPAAHVRGLADATRARDPRGLRAEIRSWLRDWQGLLEGEPAQARMVIRKLLTGAWCGPPNGPRPAVSSTPIAPRSATTKCWPASSVSTEWCRGGGIEPPRACAHQILSWAPGGRPQVSLGYDRRHHPT